MIDKQLISISLFSGAFGLDLGLEQAGFKTVSVVEIDRSAAETIAVNRPELAESAIVRDVRKVTSSELLREGGRVMHLGRSLRAGEVDLVTGGPPCQSFSTAGRRQSIGDPRGSLFMDFIRVVREVQPRFFIMENVRGLLSAAVSHRPIDQRGQGFPPLKPEEEQGSALGVVLQEMQTLGYTVIHSLLEAADYGVPQNRQRVVFIGSRDNEPITFPPPTHSREARGLPPWRTLRDALESLRETCPEFPPYNESRLQYLRLLTSGQNWKNLPEELKRQAMGGAYNSGGGKVGFYRRLSWDKPSPTVTTSPSQKSTDLCHPVELRPLSVREYARIQTFPDEWIFTGSVNARYKQIGNAVPVLLGKSLGNHLRSIVQAAP